MALTGISKTSEVLLHGISMASSVPLKRAVVAEQLVQNKSLETSGQVEKLGLLGLGASRGVVPQSFPCTEG